MTVHNKEKHNLLSR